MRAILLNIAYMTYYRGITDADTQINGTYDAFDQFNFCMANLDDENVLIGYAETDKALPSDIFNEDGYVEPVLAVWVAKNADGKLVTVGWYNDAVLYKDYCVCTFESDDAVCGYDQYFNVEALFKNCVLLPENERQKDIWRILPDMVKKCDRHKNVWFADNEISQMLYSKISSYSGDNQLNY